ncbi:hypothetical protein [Burkholderia ambifaria]|uniref:hypothetical protein n=1 Tax=Burkholderia ambifaria TaxID=152480 RepID=UPI00158EE432|nr:hypothetical protein [Burkholderia ambifaria]
MSSNDSYGISRHLASPDISLGEHVRRQQRKLGDALQLRRSIYLDQKFWIILRDVLAGRRSAPEEIALLALLKEQVASGTAFCPISESTFTELFKQEDSATRAETAQLIDELSLGVSLIAYDERLALELEHFIQSKGSRNDNPAIHHMVWSKLSYVLGETHPVKTGFDATTELALQKAFFDHMWTVPLSEMVRIIGDTMPPDMTFGQLACRLNTGNAEHAHELKSFKQTYAIELRGVLTLIAPLAADIVSDMVERATGQSMPREGSEWTDFVRKCHTFLVQAFKKDAVKDALRTLHINTCLHATLRWNKTQLFEANDFHDFHHAAAAVGYCDVFLTERGLKSMVTASHVALDTRYGCHVACTVNEALAILHQLH